MRVQVGLLLRFGWLSPLFEFMKQWLSSFAEIEAPVSVHVVWKHLHFYGFSDETIHVAGFCGKEFGFLQSDNVVLIEAVFSYCPT